MAKVARATLDHVEEFVLFAHEMGVKTVRPQDVVTGAGMTYGTASRSLAELRRQGRLRQIDRFHGYVLITKDARWKP